MKVNPLLSSQSVQLIKMIDAFHQALTISNVISAFKAAGIVNKYDSDLEILVPCVERSYATKIRHRVYFHRENPSKKRNNISSSIEDDASMVEKSNGAFVNQLPNNHLMVNQWQRDFGFINQWNNNGMNQW